MPFIDDTAPMRASRASVSPSYLKLPETATSTSKPGVAQPMHGGATHSRASLLLLPQARTFGAVPGSA